MRHRGHKIDVDKSIKDVLIFDIQTNWIKVSGLFFFVVVVVVVVVRFGSVQFGSVRFGLVLNMEVKETKPE